MQVCLFCGWIFETQIGNIIWLEWDTDWKRERERSMPSILTSLSLSSLAMTMALFSLAIATLKCEVRNVFLLLPEFLFVFHDFLSLSLYRSLYCEFFLCHLSLIYSHNSAALVPWYFVTQVSLHNFTNKIAYECLTQLNYIAVGMKIICLHCLSFSLIHSWFCVHSADRNLRRIAQWQTKCCKSEIRSEKCT